MLSLKVATEPFSPSTFHIFNIPFSLGPFQHLHLISLPLLVTNCNVSRCHEKWVLYRHVLYGDPFSTTKTPFECPSERENGRSDYMKGAHAITHVPGRGSSHHMLRSTSRTSYMQMSPIGSTGRTSRERHDMVDNFALDRYCLSQGHEIPFSRFFPPPEECHF